MYLIMFGVGVGFLILSFVIGEVGDFDGDFGEAFGFLRPTVIALFLVIMGGIGLLIPRLAPQASYGAIGSAVVMAISFGTAVVIAGLVNRFIIVPLYKAANTSAFNIQDTIGVEATVISPIPQGGYGKIRYNVSGSIVTSPAKSEDGTPVKAGEKVDIVYVEKNTYYVKRVTDANAPRPN
ncbi:MAG: hypothetical protein FWC16_02860 [Defluviitaleaceae bacterium]|nr:hypothetical protein [Defluviitaleaceae bacterium]MCL2273841.1 hypothetical protein [Defluviitaleaceae bacterium]